jgi:hypothetical protein
MSIKSRALMPESRNSKTQVFRSIPQPHHGEEELDGDEHEFGLEARRVEQLLAPKQPNKNGRERQIMQSWGLFK